MFGLVAGITAGASLAPAAPEVIAVGKGSYASEPPADAGKDAVEMTGRTLPLVNPSADRAVPTNKYWTNLLNGKPKGELWTYPFRVDPKETGIELFFPKEWNAKGELRSGPGNGLFKIEGVDFRSETLLVKDWGDWTLSFRLPQTDTRYLDITVGEGLPCVWIESKGVDLALSPGAGVVFTDARGAVAQFPFTGDRIIAAVEGRTYGLFFPPGTQLVREADTVRMKFATNAGAKAFLTVAAMSGASDLALFAQGAYSVPRESRIDWAFDAGKGKVTTTWTVKTEPLVAGKPDVVVQGWLAHHWRDTAFTMKLDGPGYLTPRGPMKTSVGNAFGITYDFEGMLPFLPPPTKLGLANDYDPARMAALLAASAAKTSYGKDTYWGAKDLTRFTQYLQMARELKDPSYPALLASAQKSLADWLTYTPGETEHYFARYPNWHALIGFKTSYGSGRFNDQHFHYGYFTYAGALLGMEDPAFLKDYGGMLTLVAKQYANWDRTDKRFPFFRTFDIWAGHSWAGGTGASGGNNQESTSEAVQSWIGLFYLGVMLDDPAMTSAGAMGYAMESRATMEYWFNTHGDVFSPNYKHPVIGVLWSGGQSYGTYFTGDPAWIYAIQTLPQCPGLDFLARNPQQAQELYHTMLAERKKKEGSDDLARMGDLGSVMLAVAALVDNGYAVSEFDRLWEAGSKNVTEHNASGTTYYQAHAYRRLGKRQFDVRTNVPTSAVYYNAETKLVTYAAYNPQSRPITVQVTKAGKVLGTFTAAPRKLTAVNRLDPAP